jgi:predicted nucleotidyltransferase component of viral defense system
MAYSETFLKPSKLMVECLSVLKDDGIFALKGGTAINYFYHGMPRLSVDIDLSYIKINTRAEALEEMKEGLEIYKNDLDNKGFHTEFKGSVNEGNGKIFVSSNGVNIKIEPNYILRGTIYPTQMLRMVDEATKVFDITSKVRTLDYREIFAGKMAAFLDRQNPRDIFDMGEFRKAGHHIEEIMDAVVIYIAQDDGMISHILDPILQDKETEFNNHFKGMTIEPVEYGRLVEIRKEILDEFHKSLKKEHGEFLVSIMENKPQWGLLPFQGIEELSGIKWKMQNIPKMKEESRLKEVEDLRNFFHLEKGKRTDIQQDMEIEF